MAALKPLSPPVKVSLATGTDEQIALIATRAALSDNGVRASLIAHNGRPEYTDTIELYNPAAKRKFTTAVVAALPMLAPAAVDAALAELLLQVETALRLPVPTPTRVGVPTNPAAYDLTDLGNAQRFVAKAEGRVKYCNAYGKWLVFDGKRWVVDERLLHQEFAKEVVRGLIAAAYDEDDPDRRVKALKHATASQGERPIRAILTLARSDRAIAIDADALDNLPGMINCDNGILDLRTATLLPHAPEYLATKIAEVAYNPAAPCPLWERFMNDIMGGNRGLIDFLQRAAGSALMGDPKDRILVLLYGAGRNGKSTFMETLLAIFGTYGSTTPMDTLMEKRYGGIPNDIARLKGARFVAASEGQEGARLDSALVKRLTGNDTIPARFMRGEWFDIKPTFEIFVATNHKPQIKDTTDSIWNRVKLVPFTVQFREASDAAATGEAAPMVDPDMPKKLLAEREGIFAWLVRGCTAWQAEGLRVPPEVRAATGEYRETQDLVAQWIEECCETDRPFVRTPFKQLYASYEGWCNEIGEYVMKGREFGMRLAERGYASHAGSGNQKEWEGIALKGSW